MAGYLHDEDVLICPICGYDYTHQREVRVYQRPDGEDGVTYRTTVRDRMKFTDIVMGDKNPSPRRQAVEIVFECELEHRFVLRFVQHKGMTYTDWQVEE